LWAGLLVLLAMLSSSVCAQQFTITTSDLAPAAAVDGQSRAVLGLLGSNPVAGGVPVVQWTSLGLRFEAEAGAPLSSAAISSLLAAMQIYRDANGNGTFDPAADTLIADTAYFPVAADGSLNFPFDNSDPAALQVASGASARYFLVLKLAGSASTAIPHSIRVTHLINGPFASSASNAANSALLTLAPGPDVSSAVMTAALNNGPTALPTFPVVAQEVSRPTAIPLHPIFHDAEESPEQLTYSIVGNNNANLFNFAGIDSASGLLTLDQQASANGEAQVTVQATDSFGKFATTTLQIHVGPLTTYAAYAAAYYGPGGAGVSGIAEDPGQQSLSNLLRYAFFLHPLKSNDRAGLPQVRRTGEARVFTHLRPKYATDLLYTYETSQDLVTWVPAVSGVDYFPGVVDLGDGSQRVECLLLGHRARTFMRAQVQLTSNPPPPGGEAEAGNSGGAGSGASSDGDGEELNGDPLPPPAPPLPIHSSVVFPNETQILSGSGLLNPSSLVSADMNNDGWIDIVSISEGDDRISWYANVQGTFGPRQVLGGVTRGGMSLAPGDVTGDGFLDVASASWVDNKVAWYRNMGGGVINSQQVISTAATFAMAVCVADIDHDGLQDIVAASGSGTSSKLAWFKNFGAPNYFSSSPENIILGSQGTALSASGNSPSDLAAENIDQDPNGYVDLAVVSFNDSTVAFLRGNGNGTFTRQVLSTTQTAAIEIALGDMDGDGLKDIVTISAQGGQVTWFKNNGSAPFGPANPISTGVAGLNGLTTGDLNNDGRTDVVVSTVRPFGLTDPARAVWFENLGGGAFGNPQTNSQLISSSGIEGKSVATGDFDHNGLTDTAVAWQASHKISVYLNRGGQFGLATVNTAPSVIREAGQDAVLRISVSNRGGSGEDNAQLNSIGLLFEKSAGVPMTSLEANQLIENLHVYVDENNSGVFEPASDKLIATAYHLNLIAGKVGISLRNSAPASAQIAPGTTRHFFIVPEIKVNGSLQILNTFLITHLVEGTVRTLAKEAYSGATLALENGPVNVSSTLVTVQTNTAPTTIGLPALHIFDPLASTVVNLANYFSDLEDTSTGLKYALTQNTHPALFSFTGIDQTINRLSLKSRPDAFGTANLTVRATDTLGKSVSASFQVTVGFNFADWSTLHPGAGNGNAFVSPLEIYAFGLNPSTVGDLSGAPGMWKQGAVKGLRHFRQRWSNDLTYGYEISGDLLNWIPAVQGIHYYEFRNPIADGLEQSDLILLPDWPRLFLRPKAQIP
jgi:hypothetical protein